MVEYRNTNIAANFLYKDSGNRQKREHRKMKANNKDVKSNDKEERKKERKKEENLHGGKRFR